jgi:hypothetical protein
MLLTGALLSVMLAACGGSDSNALGHSACLDVASSLRYYADSKHASTPAAAAAYRSRALSQLRAALQPAALAAGSDGQWQALMATLSESSRVNESELVIALSAQCAQTLSS